jgi:hypothetical protein
MREGEGAGRTAQKPVLQIADKEHHFVVCVLVRTHLARQHNVGVITKLACFAAPCRRSAQ